MKNLFGWRQAIVIPVAMFLTAASVHADDLSANKPVRADTHAPIGVMGDHTHGKGEWMLSYRFMRMDMSGNQIGHQSVSPDYIVSNVANIFAPPATMRIVPVKMTTDMHMFGAMYAPTDRLTLMAMFNYLSKDMDSLTYQGMAGTTVLGGFNTQSSGLGDTTVGGLLRLRDEANEKWHLNLSVSLPTGSIKKADQILSPAGAMPAVRLPYPMQLGSGTVDLKPGLTYNGRHDNLTWGGQYIGTFRIGDNSQGYTLGNEQFVTAWLAYSPRVWVSFSGRLAYKDVDSIDGQDPQIAGPVQTANPDFIGGKSVMAYAGINVVGQRDWMRGHRLALEYGTPLSQNLNGPQMEMDKMLTVGWQFAF